MRTADQVETLKNQLIADGVPKPDSVRQLALATLGWPYVFGARGAECTPAKRKTYNYKDHPTIVSKCQVLSGKKNSCGGCQWYPDGYRVRMYDCRGFTYWLLLQVGLYLNGSGATSQYNDTDNWTERGKIADMPDVVCCVFKANGKTMEHTGMHIGGGTIIHCSGTVKTGKTSDRGWTHYGIPVGLYGGGVVRPVLRRGSKGQDVEYLQTRLNELGFDCGKVDGIFGKNTEAAVKNFQTARGLKVDGIVGYDTWTALDGGDVQKYTAKFHGVTYQQIMKMREVCPTAECEIEKE